MAVPYHCALRPISRSAGRSATAAIAYRAGELVMDDRTGIVHDYTRRSGVERTEIFLPENSPVWAANRAELWNAAEQAETRKNSTVAREFIIAFPADLTESKRHEMVSQFARAIVERHGVAVDAAIHTPGREGDNRNHHAHVLFSTRKLEADGFTKKTRELDDLKTGPVETVRWKQQWAERCAESLNVIGRAVEAERWRHGYLNLSEQIGKAMERGDMEYVAQNEGRRATVHLGPNVVSLERKGTKTERGKEHGFKLKHNALIIDLADARKRIEALTEKSAGARELVQRDLNADLLRRAVSTREPVEAANDPNPEKIRSEWQAEKARQFVLVVSKARRVHARALGQMKRQENRLDASDLVRPQEPVGFFARFKKATHDQALAAWRGVRDGLEGRFNQVRNRLNLVSDYMRKAGPYEAVSRGERLAEQKASKERPELAENFQQVVERAKVIAIAQHRATIMNGHQGRQEQRTMKQESIEELKRRTDSNRVKAEKAERAELEKAGLLARLQGQNAEQKYEENQIVKQQSDALTTALNAGTDKGDLTKEARRREILERFKEKSRSDRDNDRGGRGR